MRFRVHAGEGRPCKPVTQMLRDAREVGHESGLLASSTALRHDLTRHSTWRFRTLLALLIVALLFGVASIAGWIGTQRTVVAQEKRRQEDARALEQEIEKLRQDEYSGGVCMLHGIFTLMAERGGKLHEVKPTRLVYDAETTSGGSGGPVFGPDGTVIGINFAITRDFDGSNFGIPIALAKKLLH